MDSREEGAGGRRRRPTQRPVERWRRRRTRPDLPGRASGGPLEAPGEATVAVATGYEADVLVHDPDRHLQFMSVAQGYIH